MRTDARIDEGTPGSELAPWYVAHTKPRQEHIAREHLLRQNYRVYLPRLKVIKSRHGRQQFAYEPLFPRYLFFQPNHSGHSIAPVHSTVGVPTIVRIGGIAVVLRDDVVADLCDFEARQHAADFSELCPLQPGSAVVLTRGALAGLEGVVAMVSQQRVVVLMRLLGEETKVRVKRSEVKFAA